jgi:hypothetical protein
MNLLPNLIEGSVSERWAAPFSRRQGTVELESTGHAVIVMA